MLRVAENILERELKRQEGIDDWQVQEVEVRLGQKLPAPVAEFYTSVGNISLFMNGHHHFFNLEELFIKNDKLVFLAENQRVLHWAVDLANQKTVYQTTSDIEAEHFVWHKEVFELEQFLEMMLFVQCVFADEEYHRRLEGGYTHFAYLEIANVKEYTLTWLLDRLKEQWQNVVKGNDVTVFVYPKSILLYFIDSAGNPDKTSMIWMCTKDQRLFDEWVDVYGFMEL